MLASGESQSSAGGWIYSTPKDQKHKSRQEGERLSTIHSNEVKDSQLVEYGKRQKT
jgi:hypothetical protein